MTFVNAAQSTVVTFPGMRSVELEIRESDVDALARGCAVLGAGGGGDTRDAAIATALALRATGPVPLVSLDELPDEGLVLPLAYIGAPLVFTEKLPTGFEGVRLRAEMEDATGREAVAVIAPEIGGANGVLPVLWASRLGLPVVDADGMGRAFPELPMTVMHIAGVSVCPSVSIDGRENVVRLDACDNAWAERLTRSVAMAVGAVVIGCLYPMPVEVARRATVRGTVSMALRVGHALAQPGDGAIADAVKELNAFVLMTGKIIDVERRIEGGFVRGCLTVEGLGGFRGQLLHVEIQNENLVALEDGEVRASAPDIITVLSSDSGAVISTERLRYGQRVTVIAFAADPIWRTERGLAVGGPAALGYEFDYVPVEVLNA
jgi:DUF917 family protein